MIGSVIVTEDGELILGTWILSKHYKIYHYHLKNLVKKHVKDLSELGNSQLIMREFVKHLKEEEKQKPKQGRPIQEYMLNGRQALFILMIIKRMNDPKKAIKAMDKEEIKKLFEDLIKK
jgi:hypothetical protein